MNAKSLTIVGCVVLAHSPWVRAESVVADDASFTYSTRAAGEFSVGLYGWGAGLDGDIGAAGFSAPVDVSFSDILDSLDMTAMGVAEFRHGPWMLQLEGLYLRNSLTAAATLTTPRAPTVNGSLTAETTRLEAVAGYLVMDNDVTSLELLGGAVLYDISNDLSLWGPRRGRSFHSGDTWVDPVLGFRLRHELADSWTSSLRAEVGGFGVSADLVWQVVGMVGYQVGDSSTLFAGWRHAAVDYQSGGFLYDVTSSGPIIGLLYSF